MFYVLSRKGIVQGQVPDMCACISVSRSQGKESATNARLMTFCLCSKERLWSRREGWLLYVSPHRHGKGSAGKGEGSWDDPCCAHVN